MSNHLIHASSPYLLQHAENPVDWHPWGEEAFARAKAEDKPVFLSIGYSTCHWCHVMMHESFEDPQVAEVLNRHFISIKVDREERPDIDSIYMKAAQVMTGSGGWPLSVFMTPDQAPFYVGTYFPKEPMGRFPGFVDLVQGIGGLWKSDRDRLEAAAWELAGALRSMAPRRRKPSGIDLEAKALGEHRKHFDFTHGGFHDQPKFPMVANLRYLLGVYGMTGNREALEMVEKALDGMAVGGIRDHVGGGFARYATDRRWLVPHFEKMLYDQALLALVYAEAYGATRKPLYRQVAEETLSYVLRDLRGPEGGFCTGEDADSEGREGAFYLWTRKELEELVPEGEREDFFAVYGVTPEGNFEGGNILNLLSPEGRDCMEREPDRYKSVLEVLRRVREARPRPFRDDKVLLGANALLVCALATAGWILEREDWLEEALALDRFLEENLKGPEGRWMGTYRKKTAAVKAFLDDHAYLLWAKTLLLEATGEERFLEEGWALASKIVELFGPEGGGVFSLIGRDQERLLDNPRELYDGALPSGNGLLSQLLARPAWGWEEMAKSLAAHVEGELEQAPMGFPGALLGRMASRGGGCEILCLGDPRSPELQAMAREAKCRRPVLGTLEYRKGEGEPELQVCEGMACHGPFRSLEELTEHFDKKGK
ncbi:thioredoxin domain-containing protein [Anaerotalea alkaliphila]|uniref:Thioredoxin domain-containing protein n=1 Tax=Anaerotalea alkaliphila TaxID=2662126 RepID=A0A7X5KN64_9FIRM|nr:thioredoxin domain-containing protein [Anaerotalea alkaliphila]NDL68671.1 thioredoxin domain-containing protein [Anaerotalea alkaliphila]